MEKDIEITKAEIIRDIFLKWEYEETQNGISTKYSANSTAAIHEDLHEAIQGLAPHFVLLTEMKKKPDVAKIIDLKQFPEELIKKFKVKSITIEDRKGDIYYTIAGTKYLKNGKSVNFSTPPTNKSAGDDDAYEFFEQLEQQVYQIQEEVFEYMQGKCAISNQTEMDFDGFEPEGDFVPDRMKPEEAA